MTRCVVIFFLSDDVRHEGGADVGEEGVDFGGEFGDVGVDVASVLFGERGEDDANAAVVGKFPAGGASSAAECFCGGAFDGAEQARALAGDDLMHQGTRSFDDWETNDAKRDERREFVRDGFFEFESHVEAGGVYRDEGCLTNFRIVARKFDPQRIGGVFESFDEVFFGAESSDGRGDVAEQVEFDLDHAGSIRSTGFFEGDDGCVEDFAFDDRAISEDIFEVFGREKRPRDG